MALVMIHFTKVLDTFGGDHMLKCKHSNNVNVKIQFGAVCRPVCVIK